MELTIVVNMGFVAYVYTDKKKINFSSFIRKFRALSKQWTSFYPVYDVYERCIFE
jgi:hypothetical protein